MTSNPFQTFQSPFQPPAKVGAKVGAKVPSNPLPTPCSSISPIPPMGWKAPWGGPPTLPKGSELAHQSAPTLHQKGAMT